MNAQRSSDELLGELVRADLALRDEGERESFRFTSPHSRNPLLRHKGFYRTGHEHGWLHASRQEIDDLKEGGLIRVRAQKTRVSGPGQKSFTHEEWHVDVSNDGFERYRLLERAEAGAAEHGRTAGDARALEWATNVLPILEAAHTEALAAAPEVGASQDAVNVRLGRERGDPATARVLHELEQAGYLHETLGSDQTVGPAFFVLTEKALQVVAGWPNGGAEAAYQRLLALLDERIAGTEDEEERSRWERARDAVLGLGHDVFVEVLASAASRAAGGAI